MDRTDQPTRQPSTRHRDDTNTIVLPRPGTAANWTTCPECSAPTSGNGTHVCKPSLTRRVTTRALTQARATLTTAERQILRARGNRRWRLTMRIDDARATLRAGGLA